MIENDVKDTALAPVAEALDAETTTEGATSKMKDAAEKLRVEAGDFKDKATDKLRDAANSGKTKATEAAGQVSKAIEDIASTIDTNFGETYGNYARSAAKGIDDFAAKVEAKDVDEIVGDAREFVRKRPAVAIGAAAAVGFALVRLLRSGKNDA